MRRPRRTASAGSRRPAARSSRRPQQALGQIRDEVGKLSLAAAEKITRKSLTGADQQRLIDEALAEIDFSRARREPVVAVAHRIYARALFEAAQEPRNARRRRIGRCSSCATAVDAVDELRSLLAEPRGRARVKADVLARIAKGADELVVNFLRLLAEKGRAGELPQIADELDTLVAAEQRDPRRRADDRAPSCPTRTSTGSSARSRARRAARCRPRARSTQI